jgi:hypothetical protein
VWHGHLARSFTLIQTLMERDVLDRYISLGLDFSYDLC